MLDLTLRAAARFFTRTATKRPPPNPNSRHIAPGLTLAAALGLGVMHDAGAAPIPVFPDPALQACVTELATANGWTSAEQITHLDCTERGIENLQGMEALSALQAARLARNAIYDPFPLQGLTQLTALDLGENRLTDVTALGFLSTLSELDLADNPYLSITQIQPIIANNPGLSDLRLAGIPINSLWELPLSDGQGGYLPLRRLDLSRTGLTDIFGIENLGTLETLELAGNHIDFVDPIGTLAGLKGLNLSDNALNDTFGLAPLTGLTSLDLSDNPGLDLTEINNVLAPNTQLHTLRLNGIRIVDINQLVLWDPAQGAPYALQGLSLSRSGLGDIWPLSGFPTLEYLDLSDNELLDILALSDLGALTHVDLSRNALRDVMPLSLLNQLVTLRLSGNHAIDALQVEYIIAANTGLREIALGDIFIGDLGRLPLTDPLTGQPYALTALDLSNTGIIDIWRLSDFPTLKHLNLSANHLYDAFPLDLLAGLRTLDLSDNDIEDINFVFNLQRLRELDLSDNLIRDISALTTLHGLSTLRLSDNHRLMLDPTLQSVLQNNAGLKRLALSGILINELWQLPLIDGFSAKPYALVELELRATGLTDIYPLIDFPSLQQLDLAANRIVQADVLGNLRGLRELDLSNNALASTFGLDTLHALRGLDLSGNKRLDATQINAVLAANNGLQQLALADIPLPDLYQLALTDPVSGKSYALRALNLRNTGVVDINRLFEFPELLSLDLSQNRIHNLFVLDYLHNLKALDVSDNEIIDVAPLGNQYRLNTLRLSGNPGIDLQQLQPILANNAGLRALGLGGIFIGDLNLLNLNDPFTGTPYDLIELDVSNTGISDIWRLAELHGLRHLDISRNTVFDITPLQYLAAPEALDLSYNAINNVSALSGHRNLRRLDLSGNSALTLDPILNALLSQNAHLTHLGLGGIPVEFFAQLALFDTTSLPLPLVSLDVSDTGLGDLYGVEFIPTLQVLKAAGNRIDDITNLAFPADPFTLRELDLSGNALGDVSALSNHQGLTAWDVSANAGITLAQIQPILANNTGLTRIGLGDIAIGDLFQLPLSDPATSAPYELVELNLHNTGISDLWRLSEFAGLTALDLSNNQIADIDPLGGLVELERLDLSYNSFSLVNALFGLVRLVDLELLGNTQILCTDLDALEAALGSAVVTRPASCTL